MSFLHDHPHSAFLQALAAPVLSGASLAHGEQMEVLKPLRYETGKLLGFDSSRAK
jgi:hypothetical protein